MVTAMWNLYNMVILAAAVMVALERPQRRKTWRVRREHRVRLVAAERPELIPVVGESIDMSEGGLRMRVASFPSNVQNVHIDISSEFSKAIALPARIIGVFSRSDHVEVRAEFVDLSPDNERSIVEVMFTDPDSWTQRPLSQHPLQSLLTVFYAPWRALVLSLRDDEADDRAA